MALATCVVMLLLAGCAASVEPPTPTVSPAGNESPLPPEISPEEVALGKNVYENNCATCHGVNLEGEADWKQQNEDRSFRAPPHTADGHTWHHPDGQLIEAVMEGGARFEGLNIGGSSNMPAYADLLTDKEIKAVLAFIKSTWPDDIRSIQWQQTVQDSSQ
jgi:mono/diheme cytochrome c family protein